MKRIVFIAFLSLIIFSFIPVKTEWRRTPCLNEKTLHSKFAPFIPFDSQRRKTKKDSDEWIRSEERLNSRNQGIELLWAKIYSRGDDTRYPLIRATSDGGFIVAGSTFPDEYNSPVEIWISKLSFNGNIEWQRSYWTGNQGLWRGHSQVYSIEQTNDGGYIVAGKNNEKGNEFIVLKLFPDGNIEWKYLYGGDLGEVAHSIKQTSDGGYIVSGVTTSFVNPDDIDPYWETEVNLLVLKLSPLGDIEWQRAYGGPGFESDWLFARRVSTILESSYGGYLLVSDSESFSERWADIWVVKLSPLGDIEWQRAYGGKESEWLQRPGPHVQETIDGRYIIASYTLSFGAGYSNAWVLKLFPNGDIDWQKMYGGNQGEAVSAIQLTNDGGYVIAGGTKSFGAGMVDFWILNLSSQGNIRWQHTYGGDVSDEATSICSVQDGGFAIAGIVRSFDTISDDLLVLKVSSDGELDTSCSGIIGDSNVLVSDTNILPVNTTVIPRETGAGMSTSGVKSQGISLSTSLICWNLNQPPVNIHFEREENKSFFASEAWNTITWSPNPYNSQFSITEYKIYRKDADYETFLYEHIATVPANINIFVDTSMNENERYIYVVTSVDSEGNESPRSEVVGNVN